MTREEIEREALDYLFKNYGNEHHFNSSDVVKGVVFGYNKAKEELAVTLHCSKETCDNCGNIHCENFQRQRKSEPCPMHISYKARIKNLEHENDVLIESYNNSEMNLQNCSRELADAKELIKDFLLMAKVEHLKDRYETVEEAEKFLEEK